MSRNRYDDYESLSFFKILYHAIRVYLWCAFASNPIVVLIGRMNTRRNAAQRLEEDIDNAADHPHSEEVPPLDEDVNWSKHRPILLF